MIDRTDLDLRIDAHTRRTTTANTLGRIHPAHRTHPALHRARRTGVIAIVVGVILLTGTRTVHGATDLAAAPLNRATLISAHVDPPLVPDGEICRCHPRRDVEEICFRGPRWEIDEGCPHDSRPDIEQSCFCDPRRIIEESENWA